MSALVDDAVLAGGLFLILLAALEVGYRAGVREARDVHPVAGGQIGTIQAAVLGLLGLLLAFSFAAAGTRFIERQDLITQEANAIGTAYLRADLLAEPHVSALRTALRRYTEHRVAASGTLRGALEPSVAAEVERLHADIWKAASGGVATHPELALAVFGPVNEVIDLHATRVAAGRKHLPMPVTIPLVTCSLLAIGVIGYGNGLGGERALPLALPLAILIGAALWITIDLDHPRAGMIRLSDAALADLHFGPPPAR
jgi:hypothetical protein